MLEKIKQLRETTLASIAVCRQVLEEAGGDLEKAADILRRRGAGIATQKASRETAEGIVEAYIHSNHKIGVLLELGCETDFVARNELFKNLAHDLALQVAAMNPRYVAPEEIPVEVLEEERRIYREELANSGKPEKIVEEIIEGKIKKHQAAICLYSQAFVKNQDQTIKEVINEAIAKLGENIKVKRFAKFEV